MKTILKSVFEKIFEPKLLDEIVEYGSLVNIKENDLLIETGDQITTIPLVLDGIIKIFREDNNGDEILLYFLEKGSTCAVSLNCLKSKASKLKGIAETDTEVISIPVKKAEEWLSKYKSWREFVIDSNSSRLDEMIEVIDTLAFMNMDKRLFKYLKDQAKITNDNAIIVTHRRIANDLNTSRVVISRLLKQLENNNKIKLFRNKIEILKS